MPDNLLMPEGSDPYYGQRYMPSQSLSAYRPTLRDRFATWLMGDGRPSPERAGLIEGLTGSRGMGTTQMGLLDATPAGIPFAAQDAYRAGDDRALAMAIMPGPAKGVAQEAKAGIRAYHGSPHDFDRFDMSRIGTGEGAQAYGHGLYFAEAEQTAKYYRAAGIGADGSGVASRMLEDAGGDRQKAIAQARRLIDIETGKGLKSLMARAAGVKVGNPEAVSLYEGALSHLSDPNWKPGRLYEVRINADPNDFLDWDKPLSQQSEKVRQALAEKGWKVDQFGNKTGGDLIQYGMGAKGQEQAAMLDAGIPGIKYLDAGSRTAGEGSRNYVVFRDDIIDIVKKYGIAAAASMYGLEAVNQAMGAANDQPQNLLMQGY